MTYPILKITTDHIISLWFGAATPIRQYKIRLNPELWAACQRVSLRFTPPSGASCVGQYRRSDRVAFAKAVAQEVSQEPLYFT